MTRLNLNPWGSFNRPKVMWGGLVGKGMSGGLPLGTTELLTFACRCQSAAEINDQKKPMLSC